MKKLCKEILAQALLTEIVTLEDIKQLPDDELRQLIRKIGNCNKLNVLEPLIGEKIEISYSQSFINKGGKWRTNRKNGMFILQDGFIEHKNLAIDKIYNKIKSLVTPAEPTQTK